MAPEAVREAMESLAGGITDGQWKRLAAYWRLVRDVGKGRNLLSAASLERVEEHIVDSASILKALEVSGCTVGDLGSGAGLPGIVLAILRPEARVALIDSRRSKIVFMRQAVRRLGLDNAEVVHERLEALRGRRGFKVAVSRALGNVRKTLEASLALVEPAGRLVLFKGPRWPEERAEATEIAARAGATLSAETAVELPGVGRTTTFVTFQRAGQEVAGEVSSSGCFT